MNTTKDNISDSRRKSESDCRKQKTSTPLRTGKKFRQRLLKNRGWGLTFFFFFYKLGYFFWLYLVSRPNSSCKHVCLISVFKQIAHIHEAKHVWTTTAYRCWGLMFLSRSSVSASQQHVVFFWMYMLRDSTGFNSRLFLFLRHIVHEIKLIDHSN